MEKEMKKELSKRSAPSVTDKPDIHDIFPFIGETNVSDDTVGLDEFHSRILWNSEKKRSKIYNRFNKKINFFDMKLTIWLNSLNEHELSFYAYDSLFNARIQVRSRWTRR